MDNKALIVLIDLLIKDQLAKIELPEGQVGPRGLRGKDGNDFNIEDHRDTLIALIESHSNITLTTEQIESLKGRDGLDGRDGKDGKDGKSVFLEDVLPELTNTLQEMRGDLKLKFSDLSADEVELLKGKDGRDGKDGKSVYIEDVLPDLSAEVKSKIESMREELRIKFSDLTSEEIELIKGADGKDGKDFDFEAHSEEIYSKIKSLVEESREFLKLKFDDLTEDQKLELKGSRGQRGKAGKDFDFEENREKITSALNSFVESKLPELKLKFSDLTEDEVSLLMGRDGKNGKDGKDFDFEENKIEIQNQICEYVDSVKDHLKLTFADLSDEEKNSLKLKFSDLSDEEKLQLKGSRGQRGKPGRDAEDPATWNAGTDFPVNWGKEGDLFLNVSTCDVFKMEGGEWKKQTNIRGATGLPGLNGAVGRTGLQGPQGVDGRDGKNGADAPYIMDVKLENYKDEEFRIVLLMSNGEKIYSNYVDFPAVIRNYYYSTGVAGGGGSATANPTEYFDEGVSLGTSAKVDFIGPNVSAVKDGDTIKVTISDTDTNTTELNVERNGTLITTTDDINFTGAGVTVTEVGGKAVVNIPGGGGSASIAIEDEGVEVTPTVQRINFVGPYVTVRQRVPIEEWNPLSAVEPSMSEFTGDGVSDIVDVFVDVPDASVLRDVDCDASVYIGAFVFIDSSEVARNAKADAYNTSNVIGIVESKTGLKCNIRVSGISASIFTGLDPSLDYFLSDSVAGGFSASVPTTSGHIKLKLGQSFGSSKFLFQKGERVVRL